MYTSESLGHFKTHLQEAHMPFCLAQLHPLTTHTLQCLLHANNCNIANTTNPAHSLFLSSVTSTTRDVDVCKRFLTIFYETLVKRLPHVAWYFALVLVLSAYTLLLKRFIQCNIKVYTLVKDVFFSR